MEMIKMTNNLILSLMLVLARTSVKNFWMIKSLEESNRVKVIGKNINVSAKKRERKRNLRLKRSTSRVK
jgi:chaperone required for assembly of F1-ATPase